MRDFEARVTSIRRHLPLDAEIGVVEPILYETNSLHVGFRELEHAHRFLVNVAWMEELDAEWQVVAEPECAVVAEADFAILVVIEFILPQHLGHIRAGTAEWLLRPFL